MVQNVPGLRQDGNANGRGSQLKAEAALPVAPAASTGKSQQSKNDTNEGFDAGI
jgi:hypothetical protein